MRLIVLGYVFNLDLSNVPASEEVEIKPHRYKPYSSERGFVRHSYGEVQTGVIAFDSKGAYLQDWFTEYEGKIAEAPDDFSRKGANNGNPAIRWEYESGIVTLELADGFTADVVIDGSSAWIEEATHDYTAEDADYLLRTARLLTAPE